MRVFGAVIVASVLMVTGCSKTHINGGQNADFTYPISIENLKANLEFLAADEMEGRQAGERGEDLAALYIKSDLQKNGIYPLPELADYYQLIDLMITRLDASSTIRIINAKGEELTDLQYGKDFVGFGRPFDPVDTTSGLVFAGYGIDADEYGYNDYDSLNVSGKIVLVWPGEPNSADTSFFAGESDTKYSSLYSKANTARKQGAFGIMLVSKTEEKSGWNSLVRNARSGQAHLRTEDPTKSRYGKAIPRVTLKTSSLEKLLSFGDISYQTIQEMITSGKPIPKFPLDLQAAVSWKFISDSTLQVQNVVGYLPGNDPILKDEYVAIGCHYDHVGFNENGIFNGADDDASGTVSVMEVAKALAINKNHKRSLLFIFHTAEEKGLLGSKYLTENLAAVENIISYINLDMIGRGPADSIYSIGADKLSSEFHQRIEEINSKSVKLAFDYSFNDPDDPQRLYYRSDHYQYARQNIPVVFFFDWMESDYHKLTDTAEKINYRKLANLSELSYQIMLDLANRDEKPFVDKPISLQ